MGMGYYACSAWTIDTDDVRKTVPKEFNKFNKELKAFGVTLEDFAYACSTGNEINLDEERVYELNMVFENLVKAFEKKTKLGIMINHLDRNGDRYGDGDLDGVFWELLGVMKMTPAGKRMNKKIRYSRWTIFG